MLGLIGDRGPIFNGVNDMLCHWFDRNFENVVQARVKQ